MGLREAKPYRAWSKKELDLLKKLYPTATARQVAKQTGRSLRSVVNKIAKLGLEKTKRKTTRPPAKAHPQRL